MVCTSLISVIRLLSGITSLRSKTTYLGYTSYCTCSELVDEWQWLVLRHDGEVQLYMPLESHIYFQMMQAEALKTE